MRKLYSSVLLCLIYLNFAICAPTVVSNSIAEEKADQFEGDMVLNKRQIEDIFSNKRNGIVDLSTRWPNKEVFYMLEPVFDESQVQAIETALRTIEQYTCLKFFPKNDFTKDYIKVSGKPGGCYSEVGFQGGVQELNFEKSEVGHNCFRLGTLMHEFIHAIGFYHQQSASNRDEYIIIATENIRQSTLRNFLKYGPNEITDFGIPYDYKSVMHYGPFAFSANGKRTIITKDVTKSAVIGQRYGLSSSDIMKINLMYNCFNSK